MFPLQCRDLQEWLQCRVRSGVLIDWLFTSLFIACVASFSVGFGSKKFPHKNWSKTSKIPFLGVCLLLSNSTETLVTQDTSLYWKNIMMQRTANENAACIRRICKRPDQPKISLSRQRHDILDFSCCPLSRVLHVTLANGQGFGFEFHLRSSPSAFSGFVNISRPADYFTTCYTVLTRPKKVETAVHGCNSWLSVWTLSCRCPVKLST